MKRYLIITTVLVFGLISCERHDFDGPEGTKRLHEHGESHEDHAKH